MSLIIDPLRKYEIKDRVSPILTVRLVAGVATDTNLVTAVSGQRIAVIGYLNHSAGAAAVVFKSGAGGTALWSTQLQAGINDQLLITDTVYFETATGVALVVDVTTATTAINLKYFSYIP